MRSGSETQGCPFSGNPGRNRLLLTFPQSQLCTLSSIRYASARGLKLRGIQCHISCRLTYAELGQGHSESRERERPRLTLNVSFGNVWLTGYHPRAHINKHPSEPTHPTSRKKPIQLRTLYPLSCSTVDSETMSLYFRGTVVFPQNHVSSHIMTHS